MLSKFQILPTLQQPQFVKQLISLFRIILSFFSSPYFLYFVFPYLILPHSFSATVSPPPPPPPLSLFLSASLNSLHFSLHIFILAEYFRLFIITLTSLVLVAGMIK